jgi:hypothetical protein
MDHFYGLVNLLIVYIGFCINAKISNSLLFLVLCQSKKTNYMSTYLK